MIRGGAIGDFILTLPALKALRDARPDAHIEILGYKHIAVLAENRFYAQTVRSIEYGPLGRFFADKSELPAELADYFARFDLIISYLYDPDRIFEENLRRCGVQNLLCGPAKIVENAGHAARQLARPIEELGIEVLNLSEIIFPSMEDRAFACDFIGTLPQPIVAIHPGSGSLQKNWPLENWIALFSENGEFSVGECSSLVIISGEADNAQVGQLEVEWRRSKRAFRKKFAVTSGELLWLSAPYLLDTTAEFRTSPRRLEQIAFCCLVRPILMFGHLRITMCKFSGRLTTE